MVGDLVSLTITPPTGFSIAKATVTVTNAVGSPIEFNPQSGSAPALPADSETEVMNGGTSALAQWNWNGTPGTDTITASVYYTGQTDQTKPTIDSLKVDVLAPKIDDNSFKDVQQAFQFGKSNLNPNVFGFHQDAANMVAGNVFRATVDLPNNPVVIPGSAGTFGFVQTAVLNISYRRQDGNIIKFVNQTNDMGQPVPVIDLVPGIGEPKNVFLSGYNSPVAPAGTQNFNVGPAEDSPTFNVDQTTDPNLPKFPNGNTIVSATYKASFVTYLVYKSQAGIWVGIGKLSWNVDGTATYKKTLKAGDEAAYTDVANWNVTGLTPATGPRTLVGSTWNGIPTWTSNTQAIFKPNG